MATSCRRVAAKCNVAALRLDAMMSRRNVFSPNGTACGSHGREPMATGQPSASEAPTGRHESSLMPSLRDFALMGGRGPWAHARRLIELVPAFQKICSCDVGKSPSHSGNVGETPSQIPTQVVMSIFSLLQEAANTESKRPTFPMKTLVL